MHSAAIPLTQCTLYIEMSVVQNKHPYSLAIFKNQTKPNIVVDMQMILNVLASL